MSAEESTTTTITESSNKEVVTTLNFYTISKRLHNHIKTRFPQTRSWLDLLDPAGFSHPKTLLEAKNRVKKNLRYYRDNYVIFVILIIALYSNPFTLLLLFCLLLARTYIYGLEEPPLVVAGFNFSHDEAFKILIMLTSLPLCLSSPVLVTGVGAIYGHAAFRVPEHDDVLLPDDQEFVHVDAAHKSNPSLEFQSKQ